MQYNEKYDRYVTKGGLVYRYSKSQDKLILCKLSKAKNGYLYVGVSKPKISNILVHRLVFETFNGVIPQNKQLDHINTIRDDNRLENLMVVTPKENMNNPLTRKHIGEACKGHKLTVEHKRKIGESNKGKPRSEFGAKFKEHFGLTMSDNEPLYHHHYLWYKRHNKTCRWEKEA